MVNDRLNGAIQSLVDLVARLRGPGGCPWDAKQTDDTVKIYLIEEAYEVLDAIEGSSAQGRLPRSWGISFSKSSFWPIWHSREKSSILQMLFSLSRKK